MPTTPANHSAVRTWVMPARYTGQYASRHGIIDNVARDAMSHRLPNYHLELQRLGYETAHIGKWHMGNDGMPRPGYDHWISYDGHGRLMDPVLNQDGKYVKHTGHITDVMNTLALDFVQRKHRKPWSLFFAHKAVHPDAEQGADGKLRIDAQGGYVVAERHRDLLVGRPCGRGGEQERDRGGAERDADAMEAGRDDLHAGALS